MCVLKSVVFFGGVLLFFVMVNRSSWKSAVFKVCANTYNFVINSFKNN